MGLSWITIWLGLLIMLWCERTMGGTNEFMAQKTLPSLLRIDRKGHRVSSDISTYVHFDCTGQGSGRSCSISGMPKMNEFLSGGSSDSMVSYADGVLMYSVINFAGMILVILLTLVWVGCGLFCLCLRCCKCCIKKKSYFKPLTRKIALNVCLALFLVSIFIITLLGHLAGGSKLFNAIGSVPEAASGAAAIYSEQTNGPMVHLSINMLSSVLLPMFVSLNRTILSAVSLQAVSNDLHALNDTLYMLPNIRTVRNIFDDFHGVVDDISSSIGGISSSIADISNITGHIHSYASTISSDLNTVSRTMTNVTRDLNVTLTLVNELASDNKVLFGAGGSDTGKIGSISNDLSTITRSSTAGRGFPTANTFDDAASGATSSMDQLIAGQYNAQKSAEFSTLNSRLYTIYNSVALLPNYAVTAQNLYYVNSTLDTIVSSGGLIDQLLDSITVVNDELASLPSSTSFVNHVTDLFDETKKISLATIRSQVTNIQSIVDLIPRRIDSLYHEAVKLPRVIPIILPILYNLVVTELKGFNASITKLPVNNIKMYSSVNKTLVDSINSSTALLETLNSTKSSVFDVNISSYLDILDDAQQSLDDKINTFNFTDLTNKLESMFSELKTNFTSYSNQLTKLKTTFKGYYLSNSTVSRISDMQYFRRQLELSLQRAISPVGYSGSTWNTPATRAGDYVLLAKGVCAVDTTVYCLSDSDCSSGSCSNIGVYRCSSNGVSTGSVVSCTADSTCASLGGGSYCLADSTRATTVRTWLRAFGSSGAVSLPDTSSISSDLSGIQGNKYDTSSVTSSLQNAISNAALVDTSKYQGDIDTAIAGLDAFDMSSIQDTLDSVQSSIDNFKFSSFNKTLNTIQDKRADFIEDVNQVLALIDDVVTFLYSGLPNQLGDMFTKLSSNAMYQTLAESGASGVLTYAAKTIDRTALTLREIFQKFTVQKIDIPKTNYSSDVLAYKDAIDRATGNPHSKYANILKEEGPLYYLMSQSSGTGKMIVDVSGDYGSNNQRIHPYSVFKDSDGNEYPDNKMCVSNYCFKNTQKEYESGQVAPSIPISYAQVAGMVWAPIGLLFLVALCTALCPLCTKDQAFRCRTCPATCFLILLIFMLPWYLLGTAFIFPMSIVLSDGCATGQDIGKNYVAALGDSVCDKFGGQGTLEDCLISKQGFNLHVNFQGIADGFLGSCSGHVDPFASVLHELSSTATGVVENKTKHFVDSSSSLKKIRSGLRNIITDAGTNGGNVISQFGSDTADVIDCEHIANVFNSMKKPVCTDMVGAFGWFASMLYLAAWTLCCVGVPAGCCVQHHYKWSEIEYVPPTENTDQKDDIDDEQLKDGLDLESGGFQGEHAENSSFVGGGYVVVADTDGDHATADLARAVEIAPLSLKSDTLRSESRGEYAPIEIEMVSSRVSVADAASERSPHEASVRPAPSPRLMSSRPVSAKLSPRTGSSREASGTGGDYISEGGSQPFSYDKTLEEVKLRRAQAAASFRADAAAVAALRSSRESSKVSPSASPPRSPQPYGRAASPVSGDESPSKNVISMSMDEIAGDPDVSKNR